MKSKSVFVEPLLEGKNYRMANFLFKEGMKKEDIKVLTSSNRSIGMALNKNSIEQIKILLEYCQQWNLGIIDLHESNFSNFFCLARNLFLPKLRVLDLDKNRINSLEQIQRLNAPQFDYLYLQGNPIVTVKSLRKCQFPKISHIYIDKYLNQEGPSDNEYYSEAHFSHIQLIENSQNTDPQFDQLKNNSIKWVAKLQSKVLILVTCGKQTGSYKLNMRTITRLQVRHKHMDID